MKTVYILKHQYDNGEQIELYLTKNKAKKALNDLLNDYYKDDIPLEIGHNDSFWNNFHNVYIDLFKKKVK